MRRFFFVSLLGPLLLASIACSLIAEGTLRDEQRLVRPERPALIMLAPERNSRYASGTEIIFHALAQDAVGVSRVDFVIDVPADQVLLTYTVDEPLPDVPVDAIVRWQPPAPDLYIVEVRAFRENGDPNDPNDDIPSNIVVLTFQVVAAPENAPRLPTSTPSSDDGLPRLSGLITSSQAVPVRQGPAITYPVVQTLETGELLTVVGRSEDGVWYVIDVAGGFGWVIAESVLVTGDASTLPNVEAPPQQ